MRFRTQHPSNSPVHLTVLHIRTFYLTSIFVRVLVDQPGLVTLQSQLYHDMVCMKIYRPSNKALKYLRCVFSTIVTIIQLCPS